MHKGRVEAFSDGVIAIIITIMVLELRVPHGFDISTLKELLPKLGSYVLSFLYVGIYWTNHHHMFQAAERVNGGILWANLHLLFWLSLFPFVTDLVGENSFAALPVALYGGVLLMAGFAYFILAHALAGHHGPESKIARAIGKDFKGILSLVVYAAAIPVSFFYPLVAFAAYACVALSWVIPDRRIERLID